MALQPLRSPGPRVRRIGYEARLDLAIRAGPILLSRTKDRPDVLTERGAGDRTTSQAELNSITSSSFSSQTAGSAYPQADQNIQLTDQ